MGVLVVLYLLFMFVMGAIMWFSSRKIGGWSSSSSAFAKRYIIMSMVVATVIFVFLVIFIIS
jgi:hypothetical protein